MFRKNVKLSKEEEVKAKRRGLSIQFLKGAEIRAVRRKTKISPGGASMIRHGVSSSHALIDSDRDNLCLCISVMQLYIHITC